MSKLKTVYVCTECQAQHSKWMGKCNNCGSWGSLVEQSVVQKEVKAMNRLVTSQREITDLAKYEAREDSRISTKLNELDLVLGGGFVDNQVVLFTGEPGIGKSTLLLQVLFNLSKQGLSGFYVSGEESFSQVGGRAKRLFGKDSATLQGISFAAAIGVNELIEKVRELQPKVVVVDSIQTIFDEEVASLPGSLAQVKSCAATLVRAAKEMGFILLVVGHINKEGALAGPKVLEHLVDTVLQFEGVRDGDFRVLRSLKNRFGSTGEVGMFVMGEVGLQDMDASHNLFAGDEEGSIGAARTVVMEGNRPVVVQIQALTSKTVFAYPKRVTEGLSVARLTLVCAVLEKFTSVKLLDQDVYVRTTGGYKISDTSSDLAVAAAILSSLNSERLDADMGFVGELGLNGRLTVSNRLAGKLPALVKLGIKKVFSPVEGESQLKHVGDLEGLLAKRKKG